MCKKRYKIVQKLAKIPKTIQKMQKPLNNCVQKPKISTDKKNLP